MSSSEVLLKATLKCLSMRFANRTADFKENLNIFLKHGPEKLRKEAQDFYEEVIEEANRIENNIPEENVQHDDFSCIENEANEPQEIIDRLREKVAILSRNLENKS